MGMIRKDNETRITVTVSTQKKSHNEEKCEKENLSVYCFFVFDNSNVAERLKR